MSASNGIDLQSKVVVITGGGQGVGRCTADLLARHGARVAIGDIDSELVERTAAALGVSGQHVDVTSLTGFAAFLDAVEAELGPIDVLVNNAGVMPLNHVEDEDEESARRILEINLLAVISGTKEAIRRMQRAGTRGHVVNISSAAGRLPVAGAATYTASKHGVSGFSNSVSVELAARGIPIEVTALHPAIIRTELAIGFNAEKGPAKAITPESVAEGILEVLQHPRPDAYVPKALGISVRTGGLVPRRLGRWLNKVLGGERAALDAMADPERVRYEQRVAALPLEEH